MKKDITEKGGISPIPNDVKPETNSENRSQIDRRKFIKVAGAGALAFSIVPRYVLGGTGYIAPSDKLTIAYIGCGTQGFRELLPLLAVPQVQVIAVCDPNQYAVGYKDWSPNGLKGEIRTQSGNRIGTQAATIPYRAGGIMVKIL